MTGYILVDCEGLDLTKGSTEQTISGLFKKVQDAMTTGKEIIATNCKWGELDITPIPVFAIQFDSTLISATSSTLRIDITSSDVVTITNYVA